MKYLWNKIWCGSLLCIALSFMPGCRNSDVEWVLKKPDNLKETGMISFQINMEAPSLETRWGSSMTDEVGTPLENEVQKVRLVLYGDEEDKDEWTVNYTYDFNIRSVDNDNDGVWDSFEQYDVATGEKDHLYKVTANGFITYARPVKKIAYKMLMIINPTQKGTTAASEIAAYDLYDLTAEGRSLNDFEKVVSYSYQTQSDYDKLIKVKDNCGPASTYTNNGTHGYFLMTNHQGLVKVNPAESAQHLHPTEQEANDMPIPIYVSRVVAKVTVKEGNPLVIAPDANIYDLKWDLDVINKKTYWIRNLTLLINQSGGEGDMETQSYDWISGQNRMALYAQDPNFENWYLNNINNLNSDFLYRKTEYGSYNNGLIPILNKDVEENSVKEPMAEYCLENTLKETTVYLKAITGVLVSCNYVPPGFNKGDSYFIYNNITISKSDMVGYADGSKTIPEILLGLSEAITFAQNNGISFEDTNLTNSFQSGGLGYYQGGINYYMVPIRHTGNKTETTGEASYGYYGVVRNNHYAIEINNIKGPGSPVIEIEDNGNIAVTVKINNWANRQQGNIIG